MPVPVPQELSTRVQTFEQEMQELRKEAVKASEEEKKLQTLTEEHRKAMSFWDRNLWGWFGSRKKIKRYKNSKSLTAQFNEKAARLKDQISQIDAQVNDEVERYLCTSKSDPTYRLLLTPYKVATAMKSAAEAFLGKIDAALSAVSGAQEMESIASWGPSAQSALWSFFDSWDAENAISDVKRAAPDFQRAVETYSASLSSFKASSAQTSSINDSIDLLSGLELSHPIDFMRMSSLSALNSAESELKNLRNEVQKIDDAVGDHVRKSGNAVSAYKSQARQACRSPRIS